MAVVTIFNWSWAGAILVYDITDEDSFHKVYLSFWLEENILHIKYGAQLFFNSFYQVQSWVKELKKMLGSDISLVIAGNKVKKINKQCVCEGGGRITEIVKSLFSLLLHRRLTWRRIETWIGRQRSDMQTVWESDVGIVFPFFCVVMMTMTMITTMIMRTMFSRWEPPIFTPLPNSTLGSSRWYLLMEVKRASWCQSGQVFQTISEKMLEVAQRKPGASNARSNNEEEFRDDGNYDGNYDDNSDDN